MLLKNSKPFAQSANANVLVFEHRLDDAENRFRAEVVAVIEAFDVLEDFVFAQAGIFERALLETVGFHEVGLVFLGEPAVQFGLTVEFRARIRRDQRDLQPGGWLG